MVHRGGWGGRLERRIGRVGTMKMTVWFVELGMQWLERVGSKENLYNTYQ